MANKISTKQAIKQLERIIGDLASWQTRNTDNSNLQQIQSEVNEPKSLLLRLQNRLEEELVTENTEIKDKQTKGYVKVIQGENQ